LPSECFSQEHVHGFEDNNDYPKFIIRRHNATRLGKLRLGTTCISKEQAELIAARDYFGSRRFIDISNKVSKLLAKRGDLLKK
jgi:hypothetical protein